MRRNLRVQFKLIGFIFAISFILLDHALRMKGYLCPIGSTKVRKGNEQWCEIKAQDGKMRVHGPYYRWSAQGPLEFGRFNNGKRMGTWKRWHENGVLETKAYFLEGEPKSVWRWSKDGRKTMELEYADPNKSTIKTKTFYENGMPEEKLSFEMGFVHGKAEAWFLNGKKKWVVSFEHGLEEGNFSVWHENGDQVEGKFSLGKLAGLCFLQSSHGRKLLSSVQCSDRISNYQYPSTFQMQCPRGSSLKTISSANLNEKYCYYLDEKGKSVFQGAYVAHNSNGYRWGSYEKGKPHGYWRIFESGRLKTEIIVNRGEVVRAREFHKNGQLDRELFSIIDPSLRELFENKVSLVRYPFSSEFIRLKSWYKNGTKEVDNLFDEFTGHTRVIQWNPNGKKLSEGVLDGTNHPIGRWLFRTQDGRREDFDFDELDEQQEKTEESWYTEQG